MTESSTSPPSERSTRQLTRSTRHAKLGGVCAGLARYFSVDTTLVRVIAVVAAFAGPGVLAYLAAWVLIPADDGSNGFCQIREKFMNQSDQTTMWLVAGAVILSLFWFDDHLRFGDSLIPAALIGGGIYLLLRDGDRPGGPGGRMGATPRPPHPSHGPATGDQSSTSDEPDTSESHATDGVDSSADTPAGDTPAAETNTDEPDRDPLLVEADRLRGFDPDLLEIEQLVPPMDPPPPTAKMFDDPPPSRLGRWVVGFVVLGLGLVGLFVAATDFSPSPETILAWALLACGLGLVVSAWWGRARVLIVVAALLTAALSLASAVEVPIRGGVGERSYSPRTVHDAETTEYRLMAGELELDLRQLDLSELADRPGSRVTIAASVAAGELHVRVDPGAFGTDVAVVVDAHAGAGEIMMIGSDGEETEENGLDVDVDLGPGPEADDDLPVVELDLDVGVGQIVIDQTTRALR